VGKRQVGPPRESEVLVEEVIEVAAMSERLKLLFCGRLAMLAIARKREGYNVASTIQWIKVHCHMSEEDAVDSLAIGYLMVKAHQTGPESTAPKATA
jgi:hypothetical protein